MAKLDADIVETLHKGLGDFKITLKDNIKNVKPRDQYIVLVAGKFFKRSINIKSSLSFPLFLYKIGKSVNVFFCLINCIKTSGQGYATINFLLTSKHF